MAKKAAQKKPRSVEIFEFKITLLHIKPKIWRRFAVPADSTLAELHTVIQQLMGWYGYHLHQFIINDEYYNPREDDEGFESEGIEESSVRLNELFKEPGFKFEYEYDFGDGWRHELKLMKIYPAKPNMIYPACLAGERACPPEDCGGPWGYADLLKAISNSGHPEHEEMLEWLGGEFDPEEFDINFINESLQKCRVRRSIKKFPTRAARKK